jgi:hypothetical protein
MGGNVTQYASCAAYLPPDGAVAQAIGGGVRQWGLAECLAADVANHLRLLVWMNTEDGARGRNRPEMVRPPSGAQGEAEARGIDEMKLLLGKERRDV